MPRYSAQNLAALDPEYRKANNISLGGNSQKTSRYRYGKQNNIFICSGKELTENGLCFRLLPLYEDKAEQKFAAFREGRDLTAFGDWCRLVTCAHWVGHPGICFIVHDGNPTINMYESPLHVLRKVAWDNRETPGVGRLFSELLSNQFVRDSHIGSLRKPEETLFISASAVYVNSDNEIVLGAFEDNRSKEDRDRGARIIGLKKSAAQAFLSALRVRNEQGEFLSGDMLSFDAAKLVTFLPNGYVSGGQKLMGVGVDGPETFHCPKYVRNSDKNAQFVVGYPQSRTDVTHFAIVHEKFMDQNVTLEPYAERIVAETETMDDYLFVPSYEEQAEMIAPVFPREALEFAWQEFPQYLRAIPKNTVTVSLMDEEPATAPPALKMAQSKSVTRPVTKARPAADPPAPWDPVEGEISPEEAAGVADMFSTAVDPVGEPGPVGPTGKSEEQLNPADILARARAKLAAKK